MSAPEVLPTTLEAALAAALSDHDTFRRLGVP